MHFFTFQSCDWRSKPTITPTLLYSIIFDRYTQKTIELLLNSCEDSFKSYYINMYVVHTWTSRNTLKKARHFDFAIGTDPSRSALHGMYYENILSLDFFDLFYTDAIKTISISARKMIGITKFKAVLIRFSSNFQNVRVLQVKSSYAKRLIITYSTHLLLYSLVGGTRSILI